jgi:ferritin-like metal-binding protein YciE
MIPPVHVITSDIGREGCSFTPDFNLHDSFRNHIQMRVFNQLSLANTVLSGEQIMEQLKELLVDNLQDLLHAEMQLVQALPKMAEAANHPKLKEAFEKHLMQTEGHVERLKSSFELLGAKAQPKPCKGMRGLIEEGEEVISENDDKEELAADLALIAAAQKVEHYEISGYGTARFLARQIGEREVSTLLSRTLGEEESSDYLLTELSRPIMQDATLQDETPTRAPAAKAKARRA